MPALTWDCACGSTNTVSSPVCFACGRAAVPTGPVPAISQNTPVAFHFSMSTQSDEIGRSRILPAVACAV